MTEAHSDHTADGAERRGPLASYRVLEIGSTIAGPFCGRLLADFGAEVVKVEALEGDPVRTMGSHDEGVSLYAASILRNKANAAIDLRTEAGREVVRALAARCDVMIENFRPGTLEKWDLSWARLHEANPGLVLVRISGYGQTGPYSARPGYGVISEAMSGLRSVTGDPDRPPARMNTSLTDYLTGLYAAFGALAALDHRNRTGQGQVVDAALYECGFSLMEPHVPAFAHLGIIAQRTGSALPGSVPNNLYATRDGRHLHITAMADTVFRRLCGAMGQPHLAADPRFAQGRDRGRNAAAIDAIVAAWAASLALEDAEAALRKADVPAARIYSVADAFDDPHYRARNMLVTAPSSALASGVMMTNVVPRLERTPGEVRHAGRRLGEDTRTILERWLALEDDDIAALADAGVVHIP
ncbi:L-carnitine dehydratase/bile acid-inducible protein F [Acidovorax delafieldii 2AN]|jgi:crotonobetainyl-CoA:carnitine CoA-transferase CaiB-like acyl-CoA transferase|uniref:L-carnitine dehydratase/bile acid-inducible protein F n=1 Tax=Acidovorax delafieldii 2AN TaxID=573060 RepID=C5T3M4_ACIDE|nr:CaiB/BaiF CoA-transferase family protein [Acidovorax delafieldii]EER60930.1 L-carnitine dehydratase/bile acid-inducible protein F [Acidovorax delafieldii 2AN]